MSTNNIGFCKGISKFIPESSSNIIQYAPYLFRNILAVKLNLLQKMHGKIIAFTFEMRHKKTCLWNFRPGPTQNKLYSHRRWLDA